MLNKILKSFDGLLQRILDIIISLLLVIGIFFSLDSYFVYTNSSTTSVNAYKPTSDNMNSFKEISEDTVAWLNIYDTKVDFPIVQGKDNVEYLNKDIFGAYSLSGSIFLDVRNSRDFTDDYSIVYGHHMSNGYMFGALDYFNEREYFEEYRDGEIIIENKLYKIKTFAFMHVDANEGIIFDTDITNDRLDFIRNNSDLFVEPEGERIIALSTCTTPTTTNRTVLFVSIIE